MNRNILLIVNIVLMLFIYSNLNAKSDNNSATFTISADSLFNNYYPGCIVVYNETDKDIFIHDSTRAYRRFSPASTYKIFNTLLAFESAIAKDSSYSIKWDGEKHSILSWNRDHSLNSAFKNSVVWYYQSLARSIGRETAKKFIVSCSYGNRNIGKQIDRYWLDTSLQISAIEQIKFLRALKNDSLPFSKSAMHKTKEIMLQDTSFGELYYKTGLSLKQKVGWFVGWQIYKGHTYYFALNISYKQLESLFIESREKLALDILRLYHKFITNRTP